MNKPHIPIRIDRPKETAGKKNSLEGTFFLDLVERVVSSGDREALSEIVERRRYSEKCLILPDLIRRQPRISALYISQARDRIMQDACNLTLDKFFNIPDEEDRSSRRSDGGSNHPATDCRHYYRAFLSWIGEREDRLPQGALLRETWVMEVFAGFVKRQFLLSCREACRRLADRFSSRYVWKVDSRGSLTVRLPRTLASGQRRKWLESNIPDVDPTRANERERVQSIIDERLCFGEEVPLEENSRELPLAIDPPDWAAISLDCLRFPQFVAEEKSASIDRQRPSIRRLGPETLRRLVLAVFENLLSEDQTEESLAASFGLSKTAFSHFAGSRWRRDDSEGSAGIPDLWSNVAYLLANHPKFVGAASELGLLDTAHEVLNRVEKVRFEGVEP